MPGAIGQRAESWELRAESNCVHPLLTDKYKTRACCKRGNHYEQQPHNPSTSTVGHEYPQWISYAYSASYTRASSSPLRTKRLEWNALELKKKSDFFFLHGKWWKNKKKKTRKHTEHKADVIGSAASSLCIHPRAMAQRKKKKKKKKGSKDDSDCRLLFFFFFFF